MVNWVRLLSKTSCVRTLNLHCSVKCRKGFVNVQMKMSYLNIIEILGKEGSRRSNLQLTGRLIVKSETNNMVLGNLCISENNLGG